MAGSADRDEVRHEGRNIGSAVTERRQLDAHHAEPMQQILPEGTPIVAEMNRLGLLLDAAFRGE